MRCNNCGTKNLDDMIYCKKCGARMVLHYKVNQKKIIDTLIKFKNRNNMSFFTKTAYKVMTSKKKYVNIFFLISAFVISFTFFTFSISGLPESFKEAIESIYKEISDEYYIQALWRDVWIRTIFLALSLLLMVMLILIFFKAVKFAKIFKDDDITKV